MYQEYGISEEIEKLANEVEEEIKEQIKKINQDAMYNSQRVLMAFQENEVSEMHFGTTTGYGEGDVRKKLHRKNICKSARSRRQFSKKPIYIWNTRINSITIWIIKTRRHNACSFAESHMIH